MVVKNKVEIIELPEVHLKPGVDNLLIALQAVVDGKLPITSVEIKLHVLKQWAYDNKQKSGEIHGLIIQNKKGKTNVQSC
jgi:hypothetical protein